MARDRGYYSVRKGLNPSGGRLDLESLKMVFQGIYSDWGNKRYFQEAFGLDCVDGGYTPGDLGSDIGGVILWKLQKRDLWPIDEKLEDYSEDDFFDIVEFLYDNVSVPINGWFHHFADCGYHGEDFDQDTRRKEFREKIDSLLKVYDDGFELSEDGEILANIDAGLEPLMTAPINTDSPEDIEDRVEQAKLKFRQRRAPLEDKREAIRNLADVLEYIRPKLKAVFNSQDEADLFHLANRFGIRHHNVDQKTDYDQDIWFSWMFNYYLTTIHAAVRLIKRSEMSRTP